MGRRGVEGGERTSCAPYLSTLATLVLNLSEIHQSAAELLIGRSAGCRAVGKTRGLTFAQGPHVTYGKNFLSACRCMMVVVL